MMNPEDGSVLSYFINHPRQYKRSASFVWDALNKHCIIDVQQAYFIGSRVVVFGTFNGNAPTTCVSGSGHYICEYNKLNPFQLYFNYLEHFEILDSMEDPKKCMARFIIDSKRMMHPPGLTN